MWGLDLGMKQWLMAVGVKRMRREWLGAVVGGFVAIAAQWVEQRRIVPSDQQRGGIRSVPPGINTRDFESENYYCLFN